jgi:putative aldouronate transport system substrate-binding protein
MRKSFKKVFALMSIIAMMTTSIAGCGKANENTNVKGEDGSTTVNSGQNDTSSNNEDGVVTYPVSSKEKLTFGMVTSNAWNDRFESFTDLPLGKALQVQTGIEIEMIHVENNTAMSLLLASGNLPDILLFNFQMHYTGGEAKAIDDGVIYPLSEEFLAANAPDYLKVLQSNEAYMKGSTTPNKDIYGFTFIVGDEALKTGYGLTVRDDWCKELGIELPETPEEFHNMLVAFRDQKGVKSPLSISSGNVSELLDRGIITSPFGLVTRDIYVDNKQVEIGFAKNEYKDVLVYLNKLYEEGLLDANFSTLDSATVTSNILSGQSGVASGALNGGLGTWLQTNKDVENYSLAGIHNLVSNRGDKALYGHYNTDVVGGTAVITSSCKNKELAARFLNYGYTEAGHTLYNFGVEGESFEMVDNYPTYSDYIMNNPEGLSKQKAMSEYLLAFNNGPFVQDKRYLEQYADLPEQKVAMEIWMDNDAAVYKLPRISIDADTISEYSTLLSDLQTYRDEMTIKFIRGTESLDNFDKYIETLESMGVSRIREIVQNAVDEYYAR